MNDLEKFNNLIKLDPNPGTINRVNRINNVYHVPGWVFGKNDEFISIKYKTANKVFNDLGYDSQIVYDILVLGIIDINDRPKCPICGCPRKFYNFSEGYLKTCGSESCVKNRISEKVADLWSSTDYRTIQTNSHKDWAENNKEYLRLRTINTWKNAEYRENQVKVHKEYAKNNPDKIFAGQGGYITCTKSDSENLKYDSSWERIFIEYCEGDEDIISINRPDFHLEYEFESEIHSYFPDFIIKLKNNKELLIEIKPNWKIRTDPKTVLKLESGNNYVKNINNKFSDFIVITEDTLFIDCNCKELDLDFLRKIITKYLD